MESPRRTIVYATDFGDAARAIVPQVEALARALGAHVHLVHVRPSGVEAFVSSGLAAREADDRLAAVARRVGEHGVTASHQVITRVDVEVAIAAAATEQDAALIVIGAHAPRGALDGSAMMRIVRAAAQPVWVGRGESLSRRVLCGVDLSDESGDAVQLARSVARGVGATLTIASAVELPPMGATGPGERDPAGHEAHHRATREREIRALVEAHGVSDATVVCRWGSADGVLVGLAVDEGYDLVVLGRRHTRALRSLVLGSTAQRVITRAPCSVLVVGEGRGR